MRTRALLAGLAAFLPLSTFAQVDPAVDTRVRAAAVSVYVHGMTAEIAEAEVGREGVPSLLRLLDDASFPRRDNVVAFLAYLGGRETTPALIRLLERPSPEGRPEEDRARLLVPHALGRIASRGEAAALDALLSMTAHGSIGGPIAKSSPRTRDDLVDAAVTALSLAGEGRARERLEAIAAGRVTPDPSRPSLAVTAQSALQTLAPLGDERVSAPVELAAALEFVVDPAPRSVAHGITFTNHAGVSSPMTAARLDTVLRESTRRAARGDFSSDVACCLVVSRVGAGPTFGSPGDGLATIDTASELSAVLGQSAGRVKIVNVINYCGGPGTNIIGCGYQPGSGAALVRMSDLGYEAVLWIHEYGHNIGLPHVADTRGLMAARDNGSNNGLSASECARFHNRAGDAGRRGNLHGGRRFVRGSHRQLSVGSQRRADRCERQRRGRRLRELLRRRVRSRPRRRVRPRRQLSQHRECGPGRRRWRRRRRRLRQLPHGVQSLAGRR
jgi:hypothetical protein